VIESKSEYQERWNEIEEGVREQLQFTKTSISGTDGIRRDSFFIVDKEVYAEWKIKSGERQNAKEVEFTSILEVKYLKPNNGGADRSEIYKLVGRMLECNARLAIFVATRISDGAKTVIDNINNNIRDWGMYIIFIRLSRVQRISWFDELPERLERKRKQLLERAYCRSRKYPQRFDIRRNWNEGHGV
jgi:hypothetical protein